MRYLLIILLLFSVADAGVQHFGYFVRGVHNGKEVADWSYQGGVPIPASRYTAMRSLIATPSDASGITQIDSIGVHIRKMTNFSEFSIRFALYSADGNMLKLCEQNVDSVRTYSDTGWVFGSGFTEMTSGLDNYTNYYLFFIISLSGSDDTLWVSCTDIPNVSIRFGLNDCGTYPAVPDSLYYTLGCGDCDCDGVWGGPASGELPSTVAFYTTEGAADEYPTITISGVSQTSSQTIMNIAWDPGDMRIDSIGYCVDSFVYGGNSFHFPWSPFDCSMGSGIITPTNPLASGNENLVFGQGDTRYFALAQYFANDVFLDQVPVPAWDSWSEFEDSADVVITSLPTTVNNTSHSAYYGRPGKIMDTIVIAGDGLSYEGTALTISDNTSYFTIFGSKGGQARTGDMDTLYFGTDPINSVTYGAVGSSTTPVSIDAPSYRGIDIQGDCHNLTIKGLAIMHDPDNIVGDEVDWDPADTNRAIGIAIGGGSYDITLDSNLIRTTGGAYMSIGVLLRQIKNIYARANEVRNEAYAYIRRDYYYVGCVMSSALEPSDISGGEAGDYHYRSEGNKYISYGHAGVRLTGDYYATLGADSTYQDFVSDTFVCAMRNAYGDTCSDIGAAGCDYAATTDGYGLVLRRIAPGDTVLNCVFLSDEPGGNKYPNMGGRGLFLEHPYGNSENPIAIINNTFINHEGYNTTYGPSVYYPCCIKFRNPSNEAGTGLVIQGNNIKYQADCSDGYDEDEYFAYCPRGCGIMIQDWSGDYWGNDSIMVLNNTIVTEAITESADCDYLVSGIKFDDYFDPTSLFYGNNISGLGGYDGGQYDGGSANIHVQEDTFNLDNSWATGSCLSTFNLGQSSDGSYDWSAKDCVYLGDAGPTDVTHCYRGVFTTTGGTQDITIERTVTVHVQDSNGVALTSAGVAVTNSTGTEVYTGSTDIDGNVSLVADIYFVSRTETDTTYYPFSVNVNYGGAEADSTFNFDWDDYSFTVQVGAEQEEQRRLLKGVRGEIFINDRWLDRYCYGDIWRRLK